MNRQSAVGARPSALRVLSTRHPPALYYMFK
jgi:hypothetical protein